MPASVLTRFRTGRREGPPEVAPRSVGDSACAGCPHPLADHDAVARRFCRATVDAALGRGCVCRPA